MTVQEFDSFCNELHRPWQTLCLNFSNKVREAVLCCEKSSCFYAMLIAIFILGRCRCLFTLKKWLCTY